MRLACAEVTGSALPETSSCRSSAVRPFKSSGPTTSYLRVAKARSGAESCQHQQGLCGAHRPRLRARSSSCTLSTISNFTLRSKNACTCPAVTGRSPDGPYKAPAPQTSADMTRARVQAWQTHLYPGRIPVEAKLLLRRRVDLRITTDHQATTHHVERRRLRTAERTSSNRILYCSESKNAKSAKVIFLPARAREQG